MSLNDCRGLAVSAQHRSTVDLLDRAVDLGCGYFPDPVAVIQEALSAEPGFAMGHCYRAGLMLMATDRTALPLLAESVDAVDALGRKANERERAHAAAARRWLNGDQAGAVRAYGDIVVEYPHDLFALQVAHVGDFFMGSSTLLRDRIAQVIPQWNTNVPGYGYVLGMYAFGLEETAGYSRAEDAGRQALDLNARDPWAIHAVAHVMEMQGRIRDGIEWLTARERDWSVENGLAIHNWWHKALFHLELGEESEALALYDRRIGAALSQNPLELLDASAMLWRLSLRGVDVGARWVALANAWEPQAEHGHYAFNDAHAVMAFVAAKRFDLAQRTIATLTSRAAGNDTNAMMSKDVGLPLSLALLAFERGDYAATIQLLQLLRTVAHRFGGSHAQRDLLNLTMLEAALRGGQASLARALAAERSQLKPTSPFNWQLMARALAQAGDSSGAQLAIERAAARRKAQTDRQLAA